MQDLHYRTLAAPSAREFNANWKEQLGLPNPEGVATQWKGAFATSINWEKC